MRPMFFKSWVFKAYFSDANLGVLYFLALLCTFFVVPIIFGFWFHSWWWWFGVLWAVVFFSLVFFFLVDWFVPALLLTGIGAFFWGASGYVFVLFLTPPLFEWAPPPMIIAIFSYLIALTALVLPLIYRRPKNQLQSVLYAPQTTQEE